MPLEFFRNNWDKVASAIFGAGAVLGFHNSAHKHIDERLRALDIECNSCRTKIYAKLDELTASVAKIAGYLEAKKEDR